MITDGKYGLGLEAKKEDKKPSANYDVNVSSNRVSATVAFPAALKLDKEETKAIEFKIRMAMERILGKYFK